VTLTAPKGGSEILLEGLSARVDLSQVNVILSRCDPRLLHPFKPNILWQHLSYDQAAMAGLADPHFVAQLDAIVFVSHWQHEQYRKRLNLPGNKCHVIQNCTTAAVGQMPGSFHDFITALDALNMTLVVVSNFAAGVVRVVALATEILSVITDTKIDSQRRRTAN